jgi:hypothetical protein
MVLGQEMHDVHSNSSNGLSVTFKASAWSV